MLINHRFAKKKLFFKEIKNPESSLSGDIIDNRTTIIDECATNEHHQQILIKGFQYDEVNDFYYNELGAYIWDTFGDVEMIEQLLSRTTVDYQNLIEQGYQLTIGPSLIPGSDEKGVYCTNYHDILECLKEPAKNGRQFMKIGIPQ